MPNLDNIYKNRTKENIRLIFIIQTTHPSIQLQITKLPLGETMTEVDIEIDKVGVICTPTRYQFRQTTNDEQQIEIEREREKAAKKDKFVCK